MLRVFEAEGNRINAVDRCDALSIIYALYDSGTSPVPLYGAAYLSTLDPQDEIQSVLLPTDTDKKELFRLFVLFESTTGDPDPLHDMLPELPLAKPPLWGQQRGRRRVAGLLVRKREQ